MTYEKGTNENYGKQVYDHYLAMDVTVNVIAAKKTELMDGWVKQWQEAVDQGATCKVQDNSQVSPPNIDLFEVGQSTIQQNPNVNVCGYYFLPNQHSGDVASTIKELQLVDVNVYKLNAAVTVPGVHRFGNFNINAVQGGPSPALTETMTLPAGTLYIPMTQGNKHWIQGVLDENPFLPFNYFYDQVTWSYPLLRGLRRRRLPHAAACPRERRCRRSRIPARAPRPRRRRWCTPSTPTRWPGSRWSTSC